MPNETLKPYSKRLLLWCHLNSNEKIKGGFKKWKIAIKLWINF